MAIKNYDVLAEQILKHVGGPSNISFCTHCMTRLRMALKDKGLADVDTLKKMDGILGTHWQGEQLQIIIGQEVADLYEAICQKGNIEKEEAIDENLDMAVPDKKGKKNIVAAILDGITGSLAPVLPMLIAGGMLKVVAILGAQFGLLDAASNTGAMLNFWGDAAFYFLPVFVGGFAAKKFGANVGLGMMLGAALIYPNFITMVGEGTTITLFGLPVYAGSYASTLFPSILCVWVMSYVEKFFTKHSPVALRAMLVPFCTMLIMLPLSMCLLAPIASIVGNYIGIGLNWLTETFGFIGMALIGALWPILLITGMHLGMFPFVFQQLASAGYMTVNIPGFINNFSQGAASLAVAMKTKDKSLRSQAITCAVTALVGGVTEPALFGISLQKKTPLYASMIGNAVGGAMVGILGSKMFFFSASAGIFSFPSFIGESAGNLLGVIASIVVGMVITFALTLFMYKEEA